MNVLLEQERPRVLPQDALKVSDIQMQDALNWALASDKVDPQIKISMLASMWFVSVTAFHQRESECLAEGTYESSLDEHRCILANLVTRGENLILAAKQNGIDPLAPFTIKDMQAAVESLHITFHAEHRNANSEKVNQEIAKLFPDEERKD